MYINRIFRMPQLNSGSGGADGFISLEDIDAEEENLDLAAEQQKQADLEKAAAEQVAKDKEEADKPKEGEEPPADDAPENAPEGSGEEDGSFWDDVDKLRGEALEVDFGDVDPNTPEGALIYEKAIRQDTLNKFEQELLDTNPRAYAFLEHILNGGKEEDFFKTAGEPGTLPTEVELENSVELQKDVVTQDLKAKGLSDKVIAMTIKSAITDDELEEMSKEALKAAAQRREDGIKAVQAQAAEEAKFRTDKINEMQEYVSNVVSTGKIDNIIIPEKDREPFVKAFVESVRIENGQFVMVTPITNDTVNQVFKEKFYSFKKGDIASLIEKAASTANTKRLIRTIPQSGNKPLGNGQKSESTKPTLGDMED